MALGIQSELGALGLRAHFCTMIAGIAASAIELEKVEPIDISISQLPGSTQRACEDFCHGDSFCRHALSGAVEISRSAQRRIGSR